MHCLRNLPVIMVVIMLAACAGFIGGSRPEGGVYHRIKKGETLYKIAQAYKVDVRRFAEVNGIDDPEKIEIGQALFVPGGQQVIEDISAAVKAQELVRNISPKTGRPVPSAVRREDKAPTYPGGEAKVTAPASKRKLSVPRDNVFSPETGKPERPMAPDKTIFPMQLPAQEETIKTGSPSSGEIKADIQPPPGEEKRVRREKKTFLWPVAGKVVSRYGKQANGMFYNGIRIAAPENSPVVAAASGIVIFSAPLKDYGETIILKHKDDYATVYARLGRRLVNSDDHPKGGDKIATLAPPDIKGGETVLHFEIRHKNKATDPLLFLP